MIQGGGILLIELESGRIKDFEKRVLTERACKAFLPVSIVSIEGMDRLNYDCSGYLPLTGYRLGGGMEMAELLEKCIFALIEARWHLIDPRKIKLGTDTVFYSPEKKEVRLAFVPMGVKAEKATGALAELLAQLIGADVNKEIQGYLREIAAYVESGNAGLMDVVNYLGDLKREIHSCEWGETANRI